MNNTQKIFDHPLYQQHLGRIEALEATREFCKHNYAHFLDVARVFYILILEEKLPYAKDLVYATALLHDIGRDEQILHQIPHEIASEKIAGQILQETTFTDLEKEMIQKAIRSHRKRSDDPFSDLFYRADKLSRACYTCPVRAKCNWSDEKKNLTIVY